MSLPSIPAVPKFGPGGPAPSNTSDWNALLRWLAALRSTVLQGAQVTLEGSHGQRFMVGAIVTTDGKLLRRGAGPDFSVDMVGNRIALTLVAGLSLFKITAFVDVDTIQIDTDLGAQPATYQYSAFPSIAQPFGSFYYELDRTALYLTADAAGIVSVNHKAVTLVSGDGFDPYWNAGTITIQGIDYPIARVDSPTQLTIAVNAGVQPAASFSVVSGKWIWLAGTMQAPLASLPSDLQANDAGFEFAATDYLHRWRWNGTAWDFAPGEVSQYIVQCVGVPQGGLWGLCDGSAYDVAQPDATVASAVSPVTAGAYLRR